MGTYLIRRILQSVPTLLALTMLAFAFLSLAPGDAIDAMISPADLVDPEELARQRQVLGLDKPAPIRYASWLGQVLRGNLGYSLIFRRPVTSMIGERLWPTVQLGILTLVVSTVVGVSVGILSALKQYSLFDHIISVLSYAAYSLPNFYLGLMTIYIIAIKLRLLPSAGMFTPGAPLDLLDRVRHLILPVAVLSVQFIGIYARQTRSAMLEVLRADYVTTARAKGLRERTVTLRHMVPNALIPVLTVVGGSLPLMVTGAIVTEVVFCWSGMGALAVAAIANRDYPIVMGVVVIVGLAIVTANLIVDISYAMVDPRIRYD